MNNDLANPLDLSAEAALELEELKQGIRCDVPALGELFHFIRTPAPAFQGQSVSMLADVRSYALFRDSLGPTKNKTSNFSDFKKAIENYLADLEVGVKAKKQDKIEEAKRFCLAFNENMLTKQMNEIYGRRERADSRYVSHESIL